MKKLKTIKDFLDYGLNKLEPSDREFCEGERYIANDRSFCPGTTFYTKKEAREFARENKKEWKLNAI